MAKKSEDTDARPSSPHRARNLTLVGLLGLFVAAALVILLRRAIPFGHSARPRARD